MLGDNTCAGTEGTAGGERLGDGADDDVDRRGGNVVEFGEAPTRATDSADGERLVEDEAELVLLFEFNLFSLVLVIPVREIMKVTAKRTTFGRSSSTPSFSKMPSVTMKRLVRGNFFFLRSFSTPCRTSSRLLRSLWSNHRIVERETCKPFWIGKVTPRSATIMSPRLQKAPMTEETVAKSCE